MRAYRHCRMLGRVLFLAVAILAACHSAAMAQSASEPNGPALAGTWHGFWTAGQYRYEAAMALQVDISGNAAASIRWVLRASPKGAETGKIGLNGVEYVRGKYYADSGALVLEGYRKDDPDGILGLDKYRLIVSPAANVMGGITENHGPWTGQFFLAR